MYLDSLAILLVTAGLLTDSNTAQTTSQTTADNCFNTEESCYAHRREEICQGIYKGWASVRCARYCGFCDGSGPDPLCVDKNEHCAAYRACDNPSYFAWVGQNCRKFCNRCDPDLVKPTTPAIQSAPPMLTTAPTRPASHNAVTSSRVTTHRPVTSHTVTTKRTTEAVTRPPTTPTTTQARLTCKDPLPFCNIYSKGACQNIKWAMTYCPNFCNICAYVTGSVPRATRPPVVHTTPRPAATTNAPVAGCKDQLPFCSQYSKSACANDVAWARTYCRAYCSLCQN